MIDPASALPLYHQIAAVLRDRIATGDLQVGDALPAMRRAAAEFGVNLHTVRHAYLALSREGLVEMQGARGTRVRAVPGRDEEAPVAVESFVQDVVRRARSELGLDPTTLAELLRRAGRTTIRQHRSTVAVVECSAWQCASHVAEVTGLWDVDAVPHPFDEQGSPPTADVVLATWFHYNDVRRLWPGLLGSVDFVTIRPDVSVLQQLPAQRWHIVERDEATAGAVAADLTAVLAADARTLEVCVTANPCRALEAIDGDDPVLFAPRVWAELDAATRADPRAFELRYVFDPRELHAVAARHDWPLHAVTTRSS